MHRHLGCSLVLVLTLCGCGERAPLNGKVRGSVTLDGAPLETGTILFVSPDGSASSAGANIVAGAYTADVPVGKMLVRISWLKVVDRRQAYDDPDSPLRDVFAEQVPAHYNANTELSVDVRPGAQQHDFHLKKAPSAAGEQR